MNIHTDKIYKSLWQKHIKAQYSIRNDIRIRVKVVSLPYKAIAWDFLKIFQRSEDAALGCYAYVILIPYFVKNPDGNLNEEYYERN